MTKQIQLTRGKVALVDDADFDFLSQWNWQAIQNGRSWYAVRRGRKGEPGTVQMHRAIMAPPADMQVDHRDHDGLNNQRCNLRICTEAQNKRNRQLFSNSTTGYKGVSFFRQSRLTTKFQVKIRVNGRLLHLGIFRNIVDAARAYDKAARYYFGPFASLNFPEQ